MIDLGNNAVFAILILGVCIYSSAQILVSYWQARDSSRDRELAQLNKTLRDLTQQIKQDRERA